MRIVLSDTAYGIRVEGKREPPLGISSLASTVRLAGHMCSVISPYLEDWSLRSTAKHLLNLKPDLIGLTVIDVNGKNAIRIARDLRRRGFKGPIVMGGYWPTFYHKEIMENVPEVDYVIRGEGEMPFLELLNALEGRAELEKVPALSRRTSAGMVSTAIPPLQQELDDYPFVARDYTSMVMRQGGAASIYTSKGCPANCSFCDIIAFYRQARGNKLRTRSPRHIVDELEMLVRCFEQPHVALVDDNFLMPGQREESFVDEFVAEVKGRKLPITFDLMCRADMVQRPVFEKLAGIGLNRVFIGAESGHERGLQTFNKKATVQETFRAVDLLNDLGITFTLGMILTDPWTTVEEFTTNLKFMKEIKNRSKSKQFILSVTSQLIVQKNTKIYEMLQEQKRVVGDWLNGYKYDVRAEVRVPLMMWKFITEKQPRFVKDLYMQFQ